MYERKRTGQSLDSVVRACPRDVQVPAGLDPLLSFYSAVQSSTYMFARAVLQKKKKQHRHMVNHNIVFWCFEARFQFFHVQIYRY